ncbi:MAG: hypothetical protein QF616_10055, partial [Candidatus Marinimicrobia bacterium]|nr:hypothetical protein [Candidatus Neomarinimicrobiota bacterium]
MFAFQWCSFANKDGVHVQALVRPSLQAIRAETLVDGLPRASKFRNHENPKKKRKLLRIIGVVRIPMVFARDQGW